MMTTELDEIYVKNQPELFQSALSCTPDQVNILIYFISEELLPLHLELQRFAILGLDLTTTLIICDHAK